MQFDDVTSVVETTLPTDVWEMPTGSAVFATILLSLQLLAGIFLNSALILTICLSPTLYTPPNAHLINICVTNCVLLLSTLLSLVSLSLRRRPDDDDALSRVR